MSIDDETVKLIELVRKQPALWNTKLKVFKDNNKKAAIWTEIATKWRGERRKIQRTNA